MRAELVAGAALAALVIGIAASGAESQTLAARAARFPAVRTVTAILEQEREVSLVDEILRARGTLVLAAPAAMRLDLTEPEPLTLIAAGGAVTVLDADGAPRPVPAEAAGLARFARTMTDLLLGRAAPAGFQEHWEDDDTVALSADEASAPFAAIHLRFAPDRPLPIEIVLVERGGDRTTIRLRDVRVDAPVDAARLRLPTGDPAAGSAP